MLKQLLKPNGLRFQKKPKKLVHSRGHNKQLRTGRCNLYVPLPSLSQVCPSLKLTLKSVPLSSLSSRPSSLSLSQVCPKSVPLSSRPSSLSLSQVSQVAQVDPQVCPSLKSTLKLVCPSLKLTLKSCLSLSQVSRVRLSSP